jgi:hypothetical protein
VAGGGGGEKAQRYEVIVKPCNVHSLVRGSGSRQAGAFNKAGGINWTNLAAT